MKDRKTMVKTLNIYIYIYTYDEHYWKIIKELFGNEKFQLLIIRMYLVK